MRVMNVSVFQFGVSDLQSGGSSRPVGKRSTARTGTGRGRGSGRPRTRQPVRVRRLRTADCAIAGR